MVLVPAHTANAGVQFLSFPAQGMRGLNTRQAFAFRAAASGPHTREGISSPWNLFQQTQSISLVCKLSLDLKIHSVLDRQAHLQYCPSSEGREKQAVT